MTDQGLPLHSVPMLIKPLCRWSSVAVVAACALSGCRTGEPVVKPLPPPIVRTPRVQPATRLPPRPAPTLPPPKARNLGGAVIVVDPGHGGKDPGAPARGSGQQPEKSIVLDIGRKLESLLTQQGAQVIMTRSTDRFIELADRAAIAERAHADLFISLHADAAQRTSASGVGLFIYTGASPESQRAALRMLSAIQRAGITCRGIDRRNFHVLREHSRPAILIECGFLTNAGDARALNTNTYRQRLARAIADGIASYFAR